MMPSSIEPIEKALKNLDWPAAVSNFRVVPGQDANGDEAIWVWLTVQPGAAQQPLQRQQLLDCKKTVRDVVSQQVPDLWTYVRLENPADNPAKPALEQA
jgi:hypothetical protein